MPAETIRIPLSDNPHCAALIYLAVCAYPSKKDAAHRDRLVRSGIAWIVKASEEHFHKNPQANKYFEYRWRDIDSALGRATKRLMLRRWYAGIELQRELQGEQRGTIGDGEIRLRFDPITPGSKIMKMSFDLEQAGPIGQGTGRYRRLEGLNRYNDDRAANDYRLIWRESRPVLHLWYPVYTRAIPAAVQRGPRGRGRTEGIDLMDLVLWPDWLSETLTQAATLRGWLVDLGIVAEADQIVLTA